MANIYTPSVSPAEISVTKSADMNIEVNFTEKEAPQSAIILNVTPAEGTHIQEVKAVVTNNSGYSRDITLNTEGQNKFILPALGTYKISAQAYTDDNGKYIATPITLTDGKLSSSTIVYKDTRDLSQKVIGYWENWKGPIPGSEGEGKEHDASYYEPSIKPYTHVMYSFLTLDPHPAQGEEPPHNKSWNGKALYESMTAENVLTLMSPCGYGNYPKCYENGNNWQRAKIVALIKAIHNTGGKFIWAQ
ncbi:hypothetical protein [Francisella philomiragia]|uniref:hypothetical protein n=1 Tax=Francisella philomiragia TaxID=28110 RepID=UPI0001B1BE30|nr:hypothetical protein [Francisella philomiragia]EET21187.1 chitinase [Francisella philomiragia subsp. philomiragia ATCC 25015]MBK2238839.1 hypothetical protein [Francisella philomiragia]